MEIDNVPTEGGRFLFGNFEFTTNKGARLGLNMNDIQWGAMLATFFVGALFCTVFAPPKKQKKGTLTYFRRKI